MGSSTIPASITNLVKTIIGCSILCVPYAFGQTGLLLGSVLLILCGIIQAVALHLLALCVLKAQSRGEDTSFRALASAALGPSAATDLLVEGCVLACCFGFAIGQLMTMGGLLPQICDYMGLGGEYWSNNQFWISVVGWCIGLPLMCLNNLDSLKVTSYIGNAGIVYVVVVLCAFAVGFIPVASAPDQVVTLEPPAHSQYTSLPGLVESLPIFVAGFSCAQNLPTLVLELKDNSVRRIDIVIFGGIAISAGLVLLTGLFGSVAFGASVNGNVLLSFPSAPGTVCGLLANIGRIANVLNLLGCYPLYMHPARSSVSSMMLRKSPADLSFSSWAIVTLCTFLLCWIAAMLLTTLDVIMAYIGATCCMLMGFTFPALFYRRLSAAADGSLQEKLIVDTEKAEDHASWMSTAHMIQVTSLVLIPVLVGVQTWKMTSSS